MILVTGGAGFIGSNFILRWIKKNNESVLNFDNLTYASNLKNLSSIEDNKNYFFVKGDINDKTLLKEVLFKHKPRSIVNFAAETHVDNSITSPEAFINSNITGTFNLLTAVLEFYLSLSFEEKEKFKFLHVSTDEVFGSLKLDDDKSTELSAYRPNSPYSASKAASDHLVRAYHHTFGLPVITTNCSNNYGPYQFPEKLIPLMILNALDGKDLPIYGDGMNVRDWLYVEDHCSAIWRVLKNGQLGETYNVGGLCEKPNIQIVDTICEILDEANPRQDGKSYKTQKTYVKDRPGHDRRYAIDCSKIQTELGWRPTETFSTGLRKTVEWYLENRQWCENIRSKGYQRERLGLK